MTWQDRGVIKFLSALLTLDLAMILLYDISSVTTTEAGHLVQ